MIDIEKKAREYAEEQINGIEFANDYERTCELNHYRCAFLAGAAYALAGQWRDAEKERPSISGEYIVWETQVGLSKGYVNRRTYKSDRYTFDKGVHVEVLAWMEIPEYKPKEE